MQQVSPCSLAASPNGTTRHTVLQNGSGAGSTQASVNKLNHFPSTSVGFKTSRTATQREEGKWGKFLPPPRVCSPPLGPDEEEPGQNNCVAGAHIGSWCCG